MNALFEAAWEVQQFMQARGWPFCIIGGVAVIRWGAVRMTQDVDLSLLTGFGGSAEDLIVLKAFADRPKDWMDVEGIVIRQKARLDAPYIFHQLTPLCELKENEQILEKLRQFLSES
jgi:predicted nucleotidyltransferase